MKFLLLLSAALLAASQEPCSLFCGREPTGPVGQNNMVRAPAGAPGKRGAPGPPGTVLHCDCSSADGEVCRQIRQMNDTIRMLRESIQQRNSARSCQQIKQNFPESENGLYTLYGQFGNDYKTYCDMNIDGGGWTLAASIHDNNFESSGQCTVGDRWSSEQGNNQQRARGDGNWDNYNIFGHVTAATSDDFKCPAYYELDALNIMIWQVPNETPLNNYNTSSYLKYRTTDGFLLRYGGNLYHLYSEHFPIVSGTYTFPGDHGPSVPVVFDEGDAASLMQNLSPNVKPDVEAGYIQFRVISTHRDAFALCPGFRLKTTFLYPGHACLGSTGWNRHAHYCGDFTMKYTDAFSAGWSARETLLRSSFFIFYR